MFDTCDPNDPKDAAKLAQFKRMAVPMLDQQIRNTLNMIWMALPPERQNADEVEKEFRRLTARALANLREDIAAFALPPRPPG
jgi:hypothetical protein